MTLIRTSPASFAVRSACKTLPLASVCFGVLAVGMALAGPAHTDILLRSGQKVAFLGDSITAQGWTNPHGYVRLIVAGLEANGVKIVPIPAGVGGHRSNDMLARLQRDVLDKKPDWVTVSCGMNDVIHGANGVPLADYRKNMAAIIDRCQQAGIKVLVLTTTLAGKWDSDASRTLGEYSDALRSLATARKCLIADLYPLFIEAAKAADPLHALTGDGVHMTPEGNLLMARTVLTALGCSEPQIANARRTWLDLPHAGDLSARVDVVLNQRFFRTTCDLTLREREKLLDAAKAAHKPTLMHWSKDLLASLMKKKVKPAGPYDSLDAIFDQKNDKQVQAELQQEFEQAIRAIISSEAATGSPAAVLPGLVYHPEGDAIVVRNGTRWDNRPLYCNTRQMTILAGEMPGVSSPLGTLQAGVTRGKVRLQLHEFADRTARYRPGRMEWEATDPRLPGLTVTMTATTIAAGDGFAVRVRAKGAAAGDELVWVYVPAAPFKGASPPRLQLTAGGFRVARTVGTPSHAGARAESIVPSPRESLQRLLSTRPDAQQAGRAAALIVPLTDAVPQDFVVTEIATVKATPATRAFEAGLARVEKLGRQVVVDTPDAYFNAGVGASCTAMYGLYVGKVFVHGGSRWRAPYLGWRVMDGATAYGFHDLVMADAQARSRDQVVKPNGKTKAEADGFGAEQSPNSRFYGLGKIMSTGTRYDMQTQFFDQCCREWRATGDAEFAKLLLGMLELHLQWAKECFDPDDDGLYESYINTWPTDSQWYNGGGTVEESAYIYFQQRAAADLCRRAGRTGDAAKHDAEADKIKAALDRVLWLPDRGQYAAYVDQGGLKRVHDDAWVYSAHLPIEAGMAAPMQAWQAMYYTDWAMEKFKFPYGGEMRQTSNWVPGQWSVRELYHGDNFAMALGYFLAGQGDEGWELLRGTMLESMYGDPKPKAGYGNGMVNEISPGGLSQPKCSIDFNDITSMFCRAVVEGLFGYRPDYPNGVVAIAPAFPAAWDHASIKTPDLSLAFKQDADSDRYAIGLTRPAKMSLRLPIRARTVRSVTVNGTAVPWKIEPWAGCGMVILEAPKSARAEVVVTLAGRVPQAPAILMEKKVGEASAIAGAVDPQGCLGADAKPGHHMAFARVERGNVPYFQVYRVLVTDPGGDARRAAKQLREAPADARWTSVAMDGLFNGDVRRIFQQNYASPRPATVSCRLGYDGWSAWTFQPWKVKVPEIRFDARPKLKDGRLVTPQGAVFAPLGQEKNIAFTSRWDNWPRKITAPVGKSGEAVWLLVCGSTNPMQGRIANAVLTFHYADGQEETLDLVPPLNFWSLCRFGGVDYNYPRDGFALGQQPPPQVQLGENCRAMVYGWKLRPGIELKDVTLETLSQEVVIGLMGASVMNPKAP